MADEKEMVLVDYKKYQRLLEIKEKVAGNKFYSMVTGYYNTSKFEYLGKDEIISAIKDECNNRLQESNKTIKEMGSKIESLQCHLKEKDQEINLLEGDLTSYLEALEANLKDYWHIPIPNWIKSRKRKGNVPHMENPPSPPAKPKDLIK